jgi:hypothetical protein
VPSSFCWPLRFLRAALRTTERTADRPPTTAWVPWPPMFWYVPGRALICGASALLAGAAMTLTLGQSYEDASQLMHGGCGGLWTVDAEDVREAVADR